jgi:glycosyltransferase involved in cell wall biosynthesis
MEPNNHKDLIRNIVTLIEDPDLRKRLGLRARNILEENYTWEHNAKKIKSVYSEIMHKKKV